MINLNFFPSWRLARYTVWLYVSRSLAVLLSLSMVLMMLNLMERFPLGEYGFHSPRALHVIVVG